MSLIENLQHSLTLASMFSNEKQIISITLSFGEILFHVTEEAYEWLMLQNSIFISEEGSSESPYVHRKAKHIPSGIFFIAVSSTTKNKETQP